MHNQIYNYIYKSVHSRFVSHGCWSLSSNYTLEVGNTQEDQMPVHFRVGNKQPLTVKQDFVLECLEKSHAMFTIYTFVSPALVQNIWGT